MVRFFVWKRNVYLLSYIKMYNNCLTAIRRGSHNHKNEYTMQLRSYFTIFALFCCVSLFAQNQAERAKERAANRAERKAQSKVDNSVDKAVDDAFNAVGNLFKKKKKKADPPAGAAEPAKTTANGTNPATVGEGGQVPNNGAEYTSEDEAAQAISNVLGGGSDEPYEGYTNPVTFSMDMEITETKKNGKVESSVISMAVNDDNFAIFFKDHEGSGTSSRMIFNTEDGKTTMITTDKNGQKSGFRMKMPGTGKAIAETAQEATDRFTFTRTGERKTIDGYDCEKVVVKDTKKGTVTESWVTQDLEVSSMDIFGGLMSAFGGKAKMGKGSVMEQPMEGFPIMSTTVEKGKTYVTNFRNIKVGADKYDSSLMDTSGVQIQSLGF